MDHRPINGALGEDQASVLLAAVEQQLTRYFASISRQVEAIKVTNAEALAHQQSVNAEYQEALRAALEERLTAFAHHQHERLCAIEAQVASGDGHTPAAAPTIDSQALQGLAQQFLSKIDGTERQLVDRLLQLEARINHEQGTRIAEVESTVGRIGAGFDESIGAMSQRLLALDSSLHDLTTRVDHLSHELGRAGSVDLDELRAGISTAVADASVARAELDRIAGAVSKQLDHHATRLAELESRAADELDVDATVQAERLDELERQVLRLSTSGAVNPLGPAAAAPAAAAPAAVVAAPAAVDLGASLSATIASTMAAVSTAPAHAPAAAAAAPTIAAAATPPTDVSLPTLPAAASAVPAWEPVTVGEPVAAAPIAAASMPSLELDPDVWARVDIPTAVDEPVGVAPTVEPVVTGAAAMVVPTAQPPVAGTGPMPTTRTVTAPPPMTLMPKLPSARTVSSGESVSDELARLLAR